MRSARVPAERSTPRGVAAVVAWPQVSDGVLAGVVFLAALAVYLNTLAHGFVWDDLITLDQRVRFYRSPLDAFLEPADIPGFPGVFRPLTSTSLWLDQYLWWRNPFGFHLTSVLLHALNAALVYLVARRIGCHAPAALVGALLFAVHPIHTEAVAWVTARVDVLATTFTLLAMLAFARLRARPRDVWGMAIAIAVCAFAAAASKEPGVVVPALIVAAAMVPTARAVITDRTAWIGVAASSAGVLAYLALRQVNRAGGAEHLAAPTAASLGRLFLAFGFYVERLVVPVELCAYLPEVPGGATVVAFAILGLVAVALAARAPRARFAVLWILVTLAPSMLVVLADISVTAVAERYLYLPSIGLALLAAIVLAARPPLRRLAPEAVAIAAVLALLATATVLRNRVWHDEITLWSDVTRQQHGFALPYMNLGLALADAGRLDEAEAAYHAALDAQASPTTKRDTYVNLGHLELRRDRLDDALALFTRANAIAPHASAHYGIGAVYRARARAALASGDTQTAGENFARAEGALTAALRINPRHYKSEFLLATVLYQGGDFTRALEHFRHVVEVAPDSDVGRQAAGAAGDLAAWLADPAHRADAAGR
ncbi:MAG: tetratricopeptide repeat protein [Deltaproteobacteria bacterium]|nr:tetratricopeptide repeat protein [Deltaproteobacteria bacterium]